MYFPFNIAFQPKPKFFRHPFKYILWSAFGNDDDGPIGRQLKSDGTAYTPFQWWLRNPFHNFCFYTIAIPYKKQRVVFGKTTDNFSPIDNGLLFMINGGPFLSFRAGQWNGYFGWRPRGDKGVFGMAFRK